MTDSLQQPLWGRLLYVAILIILFFYVRSLLSADIKKLKKKLAIISDKLEALDE